MEPHEPSACSEGPRVNSPSFSWQSHVPELLFQTPSVQWWLASIGGQRCACFGVPISSGKDKTTASWDFVGGDFYNEVGSKPQIPVTFTTPNKGPW